MAQELLTPEPTPSQVRFASMRKQLAETAARQRTDRVLSGAMWLGAGACFLVAACVAAFFLLGPIYAASVGFAVLGLWLLISSIVVGRRS